MQSFTNFHVPKSLFMYWFVFVLGTRRDRGFGKHWFDGWCSRWYLRRGYGCQYIEHARCYLREKLVYETIW